MHKQAGTAPAAQNQLQLRACLVAILDKGDLAAAEAGEAGSHVAAASCLPALLWSALAAAAATTAAVVRTSKAACYSLAKIQGRRGSTEGAGSERWQLWQLMMYLLWLLCPI